ncbi:MAG: DegQ family serine endoprotease [Pseudomonadales bacterium]|nr:DegQ family serine endoprotease [Pseudomonadales bacterium]
MKKVILFAFLLCSSVQGWTHGLPDFTDLVEEYSDSIVNVSTTRNQSRSRKSGGGMPDNPFRRFFPDSPTNPGLPQAPSRERQSLGSGFIISTDGYILTNNHVVEDSQRIVIRLSDRREIEAELIGADPLSDLALLKVDATDLPVVKLGKSEALKVGEWVLAIGSPFGFDYSVTAGIVSAMGRSLPTQNGENYVPFIQTDVAINPGNSGGPLFNLDGEVVGINSQIYTRSGGFMGVSFAIPIDVAMEVVAQIKETGAVSRGWLGVQIGEVRRDLLESFGLDKPAGALIVAVSENTPAEKAGLKEGDIILKFNGVEIGLSADLPHLVGRAKAGSVAKLVVVRERKKISLNVTIGELPGQSDNLQLSGSQAGGSSRLGLAVEELSVDQLRNLGAKQGVRVVKVTGAAAEAKIVPGDIISRMNHKEIVSTASFNTVADQLEAGSSVPVLIIRRGRPTFLPLIVPAAN